MDTVQICFGLHDRDGKYSKHVGATMMSVICTTSATVCFHILLDASVSEENRRKLRETAESRGHLCEFHEMDHLVEELQQKVDVQRFTIATMYRLMIPEVCTGLDKVIYLDADLLVNRDIAELWDIDISGYVLAAVHDHGINADRPMFTAGQVKQEDYFNAGVLLMNLEEIREDGNLAEKTLQLLQNELSGSVLPDQDALNMLYADRTLRIPDYWNIFVDLCERSRKTEGIFHYAASFINLSEPSEVDELYADMYAMSPFGGRAMRELYEGQMWSQMNKITELQRLVKILCGENIRKIYYNIRGTVIENSVMELCPPRAGDYHVTGGPASDSRSGLPVKAPSAVFAEQKGTFVILYRPDHNCDETYRKFQEAGLKSGEDYVNVLHLLRRRQFGYA